MRPFTMRPFTMRPFTMRPFTGRAFARRGLLADAQMSFDGGQPGGDRVEPAHDRLGLPVHN